MMMRDDAGLERESAGEKVKSLLRAIPEFKEILLIGIAEVVRVVRKIYLIDNARDFRIVRGLADDLAGLAAFDKKRGVSDLDLEALRHYLRRFSRARVGA